VSDQALRRGAALMASGTAVSRLLGLLRAVVLVAAIGATGQAADAFAVANKLPNVLYMLLVGGVLNAVLVPQVVRAYKRQVGQEYVDRLLTFGFTVLAGVSLVLTVAAPLLVALYTSPGNAPQRDLAVTFAYWCIPQVFFYGAYALLGQVLNARHSFGPYMWAPVVNNVVSIVGFVVFIVAFDSVPGSGLTRAAQWHGGHVALLAGSATLGVIAQATILFPALRRAGVRYQPRWGLRDSGLGRAGAVATWTLVGLGVGQLGYVVVSRVASEAPEAARAAARAAGEGLRAVAGNAAYDSAFLIFMLPHSLVTVSLATALFTRLAERAHDRDTDGVRASLSSGVRIVGVFTVLATAVIAVLAEPVTRLVMPTERPATVSAVASVVVAMILGLPAFGAWSMAQRVYYAYEDTRGMVPVQAVMAAVVVAGTMLSRAVLPASRWVVGIGVAMSVSYVVGAVVAMRSLGRRLDGADGPRIVALHVLRRRRRRRRGRRRCAAARGPARAARRRRPGLGPGVRARRRRHGGRVRGRAPLPARHRARRAAHAAAGPPVPHRPPAGPRAVRPSRAGGPRHTRGPDPAAPCPALRHVTPGPPGRRVLRPRAGRTARRRHVPRAGGAGRGCDDRVRAAARAPLHGRAPARRGAPGTAHAPLPPALPAGRPALPPVPDRRVPVGRLPGRRVPVPAGPPGP